MKKTIAAFMATIAVILIFTLGNGRTSAQGSRSPVAQPNLVGKYCIYTTSPGNPRIYVVDPAIVSIGGRPFFEGQRDDSGANRRFVALRHVVEIVEVKAEEIVGQ